MNWYSARVITVSGDIVSYHAGLIEWMQHLMVTQTSILQTAVPFSCGDATSELKIAQRNPTDDIDSSTVAVCLHIMNYRLNYGSMHHV